jgi:hypothetical protein
MNAVRVTVRAWTLDLYAALGELAAARLRWCVVCGRVGLWGWRPLCPLMAITWVCVDRARCQDGHAVRAAKWQIGDAGITRTGPAHPGWGWSQPTMPGIRPSVEATCAIGPHSHRRGDRR